jgi:hypothetical protein
VAGEGAIGVYKKTAGGDDRDSNTFVNCAYNASPVYESDTDTIAQTSTTVWSLKRDGKYLVLWGQGAERISGANRSARIYNLFVGGQQGRGCGSDYIRNLEGCDEGYANGMAILDVSSTPTNLNLRYMRHDNAFATVSDDERAAESYLCILKLDDNWDYCAVNNDFNPINPGNDTFVDITTNNEEECDAGSFSNSSGAITCKTDDRWYLAVASAQVDNTSATRSQIITRFTLDGTAIEQSYGGGYARGTSQSCQDSQFSWFALFKTTSANQVLKAQWKYQGTALPSVAVKPFYMTVCQLPVNVAVCLVHTSTGGQGLDSAGEHINFNTNDEVNSTYFAHSESVDPDEITLKITGHYLTFFGCNADRSVGDSYRYGTKFGQQLDGVGATNGNIGMYNRSDTSQESGCSGGFIFPSISANTTVGIYFIDESTSTGDEPTLSNDMHGYGVIALGSIFNYNFISGFERQHRGCSRGLARGAI